MSQRLVRDLAQEQARHPERDRYGRRLAYVVVDGERFNDELLRRGYARLLVIEPNHAHARTMLSEELDAKRAGRGLWGEC